MKNQSKKTQINHQHLQNGKTVFKLIEWQKLSIWILLCLSIFGCKKIEPEQTSLLPSNKNNSNGISISSTGNLWYDRFVAYESASGSAYYNNTNAGVLGWQESYMLRSYVAMYELTKDTGWLTKLTTHADAIIGNATDLGSDGYLDWGSTSYGDGGNYPYLVFDGLVSLGLAQFIRLVDRNPSVLSAFVSKASSYQNFIENEIVPKWVSSSSYTGNCWVQLSSSTGYFREPFTFNSFSSSSVFNPLPYNMMAPYAEMLWTMYDVNGNSSYRDKANAMVQYFKNGLTTNGTGYKWWYCNIASPHYEDTSHGNLTVSMAIESYNRGGTISGTHMAGLSNTFTTYMWNQNLSSPLVKDYVNGTGTTYSDTRLLTGWINMTEFNAKAWTIAAEQYRSVNPTSFNSAFQYTQIMKWDPVKVQNQSFEYKYFSDPTLPARWTRGGGTSSDIKLSTTEKFSGEASIAITSASGDGVWQMLYQDWKEWKPSTTYQVNFKVKTTGTAGAKIFMYNTTTSSVVGTAYTYDSPSWSSQSFTFTTPSSGPNLRLYLENRDLSNAGTAYFDDVIIKKSGEAW